MTSSTQTSAKEIVDKAIANDFVLIFGKSGCGAFCGCFRLHRFYSH